MSLLCDGVVKELCTVLVRGLPGLIEGVLTMAHINRKILQVLMSRISVLLEQHPDDYAIESFPGAENMYLGL